MQSFERKFDVKLNANQDLENFANELDEMNFDI